MISFQRFIDFVDLKPVVLLELFGSRWLDGVVSDHRAATENEAKRGTADKHAHGYNDEPPGLECRVDANNEAEQSPNHEPHHRAIEHIHFCSC